MNNNDTNNTIDESNSDLFDAIDRNDVDAVRELATTIDVNDANLGGETPLHIAAEFGNPEIITLLLNAGADVNAVTPREIGRQTPLQIAAEYSNLEAMQVLLNYGADPNFKNKRGSALHYAIQSEDELPMFNSLLAANANVMLRNLHGDTPLHIATRLNRVELAERLLAANADIHALNLDGKTPEMLVASPEMLALFSEKRKELAIKRRGPVLSAFNRAYNQNAGVRKTRRLKRRKQTRRK